MLCIIGRRIPIKILGGLILGGYIYQYTPVATTLIFNFVFRPASHRKYDQFLSKRHTNPLPPFRSTQSAKSYYSWEVFKTNRFVLHAIGLMRAAHRLKTGPIPVFTIPTGSLQAHWFFDSYVCHKRRHVRYFVIRIKHLVVLRWKLINLLGWSIGGTGAHLQCTGLAHLGWSRDV